MSRIYLSARKGPEERNERMTIKSSTATTYQRKLNDFTCSVVDAARMDELPSMQTVRSILRGKTIYLAPGDARDEAATLHEIVDQMIRVVVGSTATAVRDANEALRSMEDFLS